MSSKNYRVSTAVVIVVSILFFFYTAGLIHHAVSLLNYPWATDYVEWPEIGRAWDIAQGKPIYTEWDELPLHEANYTPIFTILNSLFVQITGPTPLSGRLLALLFLLGSGGVIAGLVATYSRTAALLGAFFWCSSHICWMWSGLVRVDNMAVFCNLTAVLVCHYGWVKARRKEAIWLSLFLCIVAGFTRQTMVAAAVAILISVFLESKRLALQGLGLYAFTGCFFLSVLLFLTDGLAWQHLIIANMNEFEFEALNFFFAQLWELYHWMAPLILVGLYVVRKEPLLWIYAFVSFLVSITIGKIGASLNYLLELWASMCMLSAIGIGSVGQVFERFKYREGLALILGFFCILGWQQIFHIPWTHQPKPNGGYTAMPVEGWGFAVPAVTNIPLWVLDPFALSGADILKRSVRLYVANPSLLEAARMERIESILSKIEGPIFSEDMNFTLSIGKEISVQSFEFFQLSRQGKWDPQPWEEALKTQSFGALVLLFSLEDNIEGSASAQRFSKDIIELMNDNYRFYRREGPYRIYLSQRIYDSEK